MKPKQIAEILNPMRWPGIEISKKTIWLVAAISALLNFGILYIYQYRLGGDFPFQDEWGYVDRLVHLKEVGFLHYLFDVYQVYFMPGTLAVWYFAYRFFDLDITAIRIAGAIISAGIGFILSALMIKSKSKFDFVDLLLVALASFAVCSLNHWATYNQSIESVIEPLLFFCVLVACWAGQMTLGYETRTGRTVFWSLAAILATLLAVSMYAPGLSVLVAIAVTRILLLRRIDVLSVFLGLIGFALGILYILLGGGSGHHIPLATVHLADVLSEWILLFGNAVITEPFGLVPRLIAGTAIVLCILISSVRVLFIEADRRLAYFVPLALSIYTVGVSLEIAWTYNTPEFGHAPRYAIHMMGGPVAVILWALMLPKSIRFTSINMAGSATILACAGLTLLTTYKTLPYFRINFDQIRAEILIVNAPITDAQLKTIQVGRPLKEMVYPDLQFLRENRLALYKNETK